MRKLAMLLVLTTVFMFMTACTPEPQTLPDASGSTNPQAPDAGPKQPSADPTAQSSKKRTDINLSTSLAMMTLDPHDNTNLQDKMVLSQIYESFYNLNELSGEFEPRMALSHTVSDDGLSYTFKIRTDATFHNGEPVTAEDCKFSYERAMVSPKMAQYVAGISSVEAPDAETVIIRFDRPYAPFMANSCNIRIVSKKEVEAQGSEFGAKATLCGSGPYFVSEYDPSTKWVFQAYPGYYRGEAEIKTVTYTVIIDTASALIAFEAGELDWVIAPIANWSALEADTRFETEMVAANHITYLMINWMNGPLASDNLRYAIAHAVDKEGMSLVSFDGHAPVTKFMEDPKLLESPKDTLEYEYSPEKVVEYLKDAGYPDGVHVGEMVTFPGSHFEKCSQVMQSTLSEFGIESQLVMVDQSQLLIRMRNQEFDLCVSGGNYSTDYDMYRNKVHSGAVGAYFVKFEGDKFDYKRFDRLFDEGAQTIDVDARRVIYEELDRAVMETACLLPIFNKVQPYVWNKDLQVLNYPNYYFVYDWSWA